MKILRAIWEWLICDQDADVFDPIEEEITRMDEVAALRAMKEKK